MTVLTPGVGQQNLGFFETFCQNNAFAVRLFAGEAEAMAWLTRQFQRTQGLPLPGGPDGGHISLAPRAGNGAAVEEWEP